MLVEKLVAQRFTTFVFERFITGIPPPNTSQPPHSVAACVFEVLIGFVVVPYRSISVLPLNPCFHPHSVARLAQSNFADGNKFDHRLLAAMLPPPSLVQPSRCFRFLSSTSGSACCRQLRLSGLWPCSMLFKM
jgi:hypothetical protein